LLSGCSLVFVEGPNDANDARVYPDCSDSMALPILDGLLAAGTALEALASSGIRQDTGAALAMAGIYAFSAVVGNSRVEDCRRARMRYVATSQQGSATGSR
jgi:hypothetical protein